MSLEKSKVLPTSQKAIRNVRKTSLSSNVEKALPKNRYSKRARLFIKSLEDRDNAEVQAKFKRALLDENSTREEILVSVMPIQHSTIHADIKFNDNGKGGTILKTSLPSQLKKTYDEAEEELAKLLEHQYQELVSSGKAFSEIELLDIDLMLRKIDKPLKDRFPPI